MFELIEVLGEAVNNCFSAFLLQKQHPRALYTLSADTFPHRITRPSAIMAETAPSFFRCFFFIRFDISDGIGASVNIVHHPH
nr:MAG TPA: hypothetical protein [Caudoviricetes sp.]